MQPQKNSEKFIFVVQKINVDTVDMMECALKHVETQMGNLLLAMGDDPLSPEVQ